MRERATTFPSGGDYNAWQMIKQYEVSALSEFPCSIPMRRLLLNVAAGGSNGAPVLSGFASLNRSTILYRKPQAHSIRSPSDRKSNADDRRRLTSALILR
jgi:hypothetical protein